jgi:hypothetical protein
MQMKRDWTRKYATIAGFFLSAGMAAAALMADAKPAPSEDAMAIRRIEGVGRADESAGELASLFKTASAKVRQMVLHPTGTEAGQEFRRARAAQLSDQIDQVLLSLKARVRPWASGAASDAVAAGRVTGNQQARDAGISGEQIQGSFNLIDVGTVKVFARQITMDLDKAADSMGGRAKRLLRQTAQQGLSQADISRILAGGVITGQPVQTIRELREELREVHGDRVSFKDKNGDEISFEVGYYAELVAISQTRQATVAARHERLQELDIDLVSIIGTVSENFCTAFLGQVFSLSGKSSKYPAYDSLPNGGAPFHPHCGKNTRAFVEELASEKQLDAAEILDDSRKLLGMNQTEAQRAFKDLQIHQQVVERYRRSAAAA